MIWLLIIPVLPYFFILLGIYRNLRKIKPFSQNGISPVKASVIIACKNEEKSLPDLLSYLSSQNYDRDHFEVIIVDDNSSDNTFIIASEYKLIQNFKVLHNPGKGKKSAVRTGVALASGELIITTDADCCLDKKWLSSITAFYSETKAEMIIAPVQLENRPGFPARFRELEFLSLQGITAGTAEEGNPVMCNGANLAFTKAAYNRHSDNLHDEILSGEDIFFLHSLKKEPGSKIAWLDSIEGTVTTCHTDSFKSFVNQRTRWISKAKAYEDPFTILISIVTFVTIFATLSLLITGMIYPEFLPVFVASFLLKSIPDFLILFNTTGRYGKRHLMKWFIPSQIVYPFYVIIVTGCSLFSASRWK